MSSRPRATWCRPSILEHDAARGPSGPRDVLGSAAAGPVLFGAVTRVDGGVYNSALTIGEKRSLQTAQAKLRPLWFGEAVPLGDVFPVLASRFPRAVRAGHEVALQHAAGARIGVLNCYEDTLSSVARRIAQSLPDLIVNITNDAWFAGSAESELHLRLAIPRAVETRLDLVRAVNGGVPSWVDATGRVRARTATAEPNVLLVTPALRQGGPSWFVRFGEAPLWLLLTALIGAAALRRKARERELRRGYSAAS